MGNNTALKNWGALIAIILGTAVLSAVFPALVSSSGGSGVATPTFIERVPTETVPLIGPILAEQGVESITSLQIMAVMAALVIGVVLVSGGGLAFVYNFLDNFTNNTKASESFKENASNLEKSEKDKIQQMREGRVTATKPELHLMPRWETLATTFMILMFAAFFGMMVNRTFFPEGSLVREADGVIIPTGAIIIGLLFWVTTVLAMVFLRQEYGRLFRLSGQARIAGGFLAVAFPITAIITLVFILFALSGAVTDSLGITVGNATLLTIFCAIIFASQKEEAPQIQSLDKTDYNKIPWDFLAILITGLVVVGLGVGLVVFLNVPAP